MVWTPGKGGSKASKDYYREKKKEYNQPQAVASRELDRIVDQGQKDQDYKSGISGADRVLADMPKRKRDFVLRNKRKDGSLNSAALSMLNEYWDDRSDYQRDLNTFIKSGPLAKEAYLDRFPVGGRINLGIPAAFNALSKMAIPAPIRALGTIAKDVATLGGRGLKALVPKGIRKDLGFHKNKFMNDLSNAGPGIKKEFKKLAGLNSMEESLLNTINTEMTSSQKSAQELLQAQNEDWSDAILGDDIKDAENKIMDDAEKELDEMAIAYDPTQDVDTRSSGPDEVEDWMGEIQPRISGALDQTDLTQEEDIFDVSQNVMPHVPITKEQKGKEVDEAFGWLPGTSIDPYSSQDDVDTDWLLDRWYNEMREAQEKGMEYLPWEGVVTESPWDLEQWQLPRTSEIQDQIRWNTANRPLDWSGGETPELTEDFIQEYIDSQGIKTGLGLW